MTDYLPRTNAVLNDQGLKVAPPPAGPKVTLLGITSNTGINLLEPFTVGSVEKAISSLYFETAGTETLSSFSGRWPGELALALEEAVNAGAPNIEIMVIGHYTGDALMNYIHPTGRHSLRYNDLSGAYEVLKNRELDVVVPVGAYIDDVLTESSTYNFGKQLANFCFQATTENNSCIGVIGTRPVLSWAFRNRQILGTGDQTSSLTISGEINSLFGSPTTGVLSASVQKAGIANTEFATPSAMLVNEWHAYHTYPQNGGEFNTLVYETANYNPVYLAWLSGAADQNGATLHNISATSATAVNSAYFPYWQAAGSDGTLAVDSRNIKVDAGAYMNVFSAPLRSINTQVTNRALAVGASPASTSRNTDGAAAYAGMITSLAPQSSTTNKPMGGVVQLKTLSRKQANDMTGMRHVTMFTRTNGLTVASGVTGAYNVSRYIRSDYNRLTTVRIVHAVVDLIRSVADKYIGEPNNAPRMNALDAEIDQVLLSLKGSGALNSYQFAISSTPDQRVLGELDINLTLVPAFEITRINLVVSLSKEL